ncbi:hypothetical protein IU450_35205 [Nocardia abscessus]|uniref:hypothetical protein n=1 Tax=Nocardia abscessus TaxID=120957 RepID=UPI0018945DBC|nr:hypothetical protein [Nocardia abscessus]MBF6341103.1 hypothetical protein [Nocardia abscessus]
MTQNDPTPAPVRGNRYGSTHFWTVVGSSAGVVSVVVALVVFGVTQCSGPNSASEPSGIPPVPTTGPTSSTELPNTAAPLAQGHGRLINVEGIDLDNGQVRDQNEPGIDMSPSKTGDSLNAMTHGRARFAVPREDIGPDRCTKIPPVAWTQTLDDVYHLRPGSHLCVQTDQGNLADLTLTHIPSAAEQYLEFDFVTRRTA